MPHSHHSHSGQFCEHARGTLEEVVLEAIRQGFEVFGLSEHVPRYRVQDLYPEEDGLSLDTLRMQFSSFLQEANRLKAKYASQINLLVGLETEYVTSLDLDRLEELLGDVGKQVEYLVGSIHHVNEIPIDFDRPTYEKAVASLSPKTPDPSLELYLCHYLGAQFELLQRFQPEIIGHFDLCRLYHPELSFSDYPTARDMMERNVAHAVGYGALFEINSAALRKDWETPYPGEDVVKIVLRHGGKFALSDDSHGPHAVGSNYHLLPDYIKRVGIKELWHLTRSDVANSRGRKVRAERLAGNWWDHVFWVNRVAAA